MNKYACVYAIICGRIQPLCANPLGSSQHYVMTLILLLGFWMTGYSQPQAKDHQICLGTSKVDTVLIQELFESSGPSGVRIQILESPVHGRAELLTANTQLRYTSSSSPFLEDSISFTVCDINDMCDNGKIYIDFIPENQVHTSCDLAYTYQDQVVAGDVLYNDFSFDDIDLEVDISFLIPPSNGKVNLKEDGSFEYTPNPGFIGEDSFSYLACTKTGSRHCDKNKVHVYVLPKELSCESLVVAIDDCWTIDYFGKVSSNVLVNDAKFGLYNAEVSPLLIKYPEHGSVQIDRFGNFSYINEKRGFGYDDFKYEVCIKEGPCQRCDTAKVYFKLDDAMHACQDLQLDLADDLLIGCGDQSIIGNVFSNDLNFLNSRLTVRLDPGFLPRFGNSTVRNDGYISYQPNSGFRGRDNFGVIICDNGNCDRNTVHVDIRDPFAPVISDDSYDINSGQCRMLALEMNDFVFDGWDWKTFKVISGGQSGDFNSTTNGVEFCPRGGFVGCDTVVYLVHSIDSKCQEELIDTGRIYFKFFPFLNLENKIELSYTSYNGRHYLQWEYLLNTTWNSLTLRAINELGGYLDLDLNTTSTEADVTNDVSQNYTQFQLCGRTSEKTFCSNQITIDSFSERPGFYYDGQEVTSSHSELDFKVWTINGLDCSGLSLRSGVYIIQYKWEGESQYQKLLIP